MASNFPFIKLKDICVKITKGSTPTKKDGGFSEQGINFIKAESASYDGVLDESKFTFVTEEIYGKYKRSQLEENDILFSMAGAFLGKTGLVEKKHLPANTNQALALIRVDSSLASPKFVLYSLQQRRIIHFVNNSISQSAQPNINLQQIGDLDIKFPAREIQDSIVDVLDSIVQRTLVNRQTNQTLEQMAQALFKSWFVDFDPVIDNALAVGSEIPDALQPRVEIRKKAHALQKQNPNLQPLPAATQSLFPSQFENCGDNTLGIQGWIPKGWKISELGDFIRFANGKAIKSSDDGIYPIYGANGIIGKTTEGRFKNAVVIGRVGAYCGAIEYCRGDFWSSDNTIVATSKISERQIPHILYLLKHLDLNQYAGGAAQPLLNQTTLNKLKVPFAEIDCLNQYNTFINSLLLKQIENTEEIEKLSSIRDTLLPKLISGEIILNKDVEQ